ncbi:hypothetical protein KVP10_07575 [Candidimonas humi]|jgi:hypothetical protein|uniref:Uncharacterized protein n=1 Tax=Candidimonas humi TaxID=683355 RepID=A0ABV8NX70_9BURK|nr:hypothetical protein [Candidimonas humi]MBV6304741.1 hypothetical protein [Candidimonas humi]
MHYFSTVKEKCKKIHFYFWSAAMGRYAAPTARPAIPFYFLGGFLCRPEPSHGLRAA